MDQNVQTSEQDSPIREPEKVDGKNEKMLKENAMAGSIVNI